MFVYIRLLAQPTNQPTNNDNNGTPNRIIIKLLDVTFKWNTIYNDDI